MPPLALEVYDNYGTQYRPGFRNLRFAKTFYGGEDQWMVFVLDRDSSKDYPDVAYGNDVILRKGLVPVFAGEIRNIEQDVETSVVKVLGNWVYLDDYSYGDKGKLWVDTRYGRWEPATADELGNAAYRPERYEQDNQNRLYIAARKGESFGNAPWVYGGWYFKIPYDNVKRITFDFWTALDLNWKVDLLACAANWAGCATLWSRAVGAIGAQDITLIVERPNLVFRLYRDAANADYADETGTTYLRVFNLKLFGSTNIAPTSSDVAGDIVDEMVAASTPISADKSLIAPIALVLSPVAFERGETCHEALKVVAFYGDAQHKLYGWGVEGGGNRVFIRQPDYSSVRYVVHVNDAKRILLRGTTHGDFLTEGWGKYRDEEGFTQYTNKYYAHVTPAGIIANMTSTGDDLASTVFGVKRSAPVDFGPMQAAMAVDAIEQYLIEHAHPLITSNVEVFYPVKDLHRGGVEIHPAEMETGYLVQIPHFRAVEVQGPAASDVRDWGTTFLLMGYQHDDEKGSTRLFPEEEEWDLARLSTKVHETAREMEIL